MKVIENHDIYDAMYEKYTARYKPGFIEALRTSLQKLREEGKTDTDLILLEEGVVMNIWDGAIFLAPEKQKEWETQ